MSNGKYIISLLELFQGKISLTEILEMELPMLKELQISKNDFLAEQQKQREKLEREQQAKIKSKK